MAVSRTRQAARCVDGPRPRWRAGLGAPRVAVDAVRRMRPMILPPLDHRTSLAVFENQPSSEVLPGSLRHAEQYEDVPPSGSADGPPFSEASRRSGLWIRALAGGNRFLRPLARRVALGQFAADDQAAENPWVRRWLIGKFVRQRTSGRFLRCPQRSPILPTRLVAHRRMLAWTFGRNHPRIVLCNFSYSTSVGLRL